MNDGTGPKAPAAGFRVRAQPMVKDEQAELWRPVNTHHVDPLSIVTLELCNELYDIVAHRIADSKEILRCTITPDIEYHEPTQSFHHWSTAKGSQRHGLTFSNCTAATKFRQRIQSIVGKFPPTSADITTDRCEKADNPGAKPIMKVSQRPPKRPEKPLSLLSSEEEPPETPPPRLPVRTVTPPTQFSHSRLLSTHSVDAEPQPITPLLPPRLVSNLNSHPVQRSLSTMAASSAVAAHKPRQVLIIKQDRSSLSRAASQQAMASTVARLQGKYSDYRDYELTPLPKREIRDACVGASCDSSSSAASSMCANDSVPLNTKPIPLPTKGKQLQNPSCAKGKEMPCREKLLCEVCDERFYESENVKGACRQRRGDSDRLTEACTCTPALNCCLRKCTADSNGRYSPAWQSVKVVEGRKCRRRTLFVLLAIIFPCILCYKPCQQCNKRGKKRNCWGAKHIPVRSKESLT
ncbi:sprouty-related, EVH1 domain-containing protein 1-like isoform X2 [Watersipora subatra]|uniref:sprouty-related, EVH1 domain-containing protein 1-like isoform X2 n=1 Tax=Watersipora subatra TaxID=2589382 RepID=UPI00355BF1A9